MRISERKTTAAVLRFILGEKLDHDFCSLVGCSMDLWRKLENGDRRMTERTAAHVESSTGVSRVWLLAGNPKVKPVAVDGSPFNLGSFRNFKATQITGDKRTLGLAIYPAGHLPSLVATAAAAARDGKLASFAVELEAAVDSLRRQYGFDKDVLANVSEAMRSEPESFLFEVTDSPAEHNKEWKARLALALNLAKLGGVPTACQTIRRDAGNKSVTELKVVGVGAPSLPSQKAPRSSRSKAKP